MSDRPFERAVHDWLDDGSDRTPPTAIQAVIVAVRTTPQERRLLISWRPSRMKLPIPLAAATALAVVAIGAALYTVNPWFGPGSSPAPSGPAPSDTPRPATGGTEGWIPWTSTRYGYTIAYPQTGWIPIAGDLNWVFGVGLPHPSNSTAVDRFETLGAADARLRVSVWSFDLDPGATLEDWIFAFCDEYYVGGRCSGVMDMRSGTTPPGITRILGWTDPRGAPMAGFSAGGKAFVLGIWSRGGQSIQETEQLLAAFLSTMTPMRPSQPAPS